MSSDANGSGGSVSPGVDAAPRRRTDLAEVEVDGETVIYDETTQGLHLLNTTATVVWGCLDGETTIAELATDLAEASDTDRSVVEEHLLQVVGDLADLGLLDAEAGSGA